MDPNLFAVDWEQLAEGLAAIVALAFFVERALALVFENRHIRSLVTGRGVKELLAFGLAFSICSRADFDIIAILLHLPEPDWFGLTITAAVIAGGSKASIKLFHDVIGAKPQHMQDKAKNSGG